MGIIGFRWERNRFMEATKENRQKRRKRYRRIIWLGPLLRIIAFPIMLIVKLYNWTYED